MSYDIQTEKPRRNKAGGGMFFIIILAVGGYLIFSNLGRAPKPQDGAGVLERDNGAAVESDFDRQARADQKEFERNRDEILGEEESVAGKQMPSTGRTGAANGWDLEDVATQKNAKTTARQPTNSKTQKGDWQIEEVDNKKKNNDNQFQFSNQKTNPPAKPKSDWEIEDVDAKKKTEKGDWAIEETNTEKKKK